MKGFSRQEYYDALLLEQDKALYNYVQQKRNNRKPDVQKTAQALINHLYNQAVLELEKEINKILK